MPTTMSHHGDFQDRSDEVHTQNHTRMPSFIRIHKFSNVCALKAANRSTFHIYWQSLSTRHEKPILSSLAAASWGPSLAALLLLLPLLMLLTNKRANCATESVNSGRYANCQFGECREPTNEQAEKIDRNRWNVI